MRKIVEKISYNPETDHFTVQYSNVKVFIEEKNFSINAIKNIILFIDSTNSSQIVEDKKYQVLFVEGEFCFTELKNQ